MSLSVGIVGLPNVGKSTLFNALLKKEAALAANYPFATIDPNIGVVPVPDGRLLKLSEAVKASENLLVLPPLVPATVEFVDIAGLVKGASEGAGLGNKFLAHIREVDAICHVVRNFADPDIVREGSTDPESDLSVIEMELMMADLQTLEKARDGEKKRLKEPNGQYVVSAIHKLIEGVKAGTPARAVSLTEEELAASHELHLLTAKPILIALNSDEGDLARSKEVEDAYAKKVGVSADQVIVICAKVESELSGLSAEDQAVYLSDLGVTESGLERLIIKAFKTLKLMTFLTAGEKEVRAWTIPLDTKAPVAAGVIHTDFEKKFIKADVVGFDDFVTIGGWKACREVGKVRSEGREYVMGDGDVVEFKIGA